MMKRFLILILVLPQLASAQENIPIGAWRSHFSFRDAHAITLTESGAYCAGANSLFFLNLQDNSLNQISKIDGLSRADISTINYNHFTTTLVIAYVDGTIDLLKNNEIVTIDEIASTAISGSKLINHITFNQEIAYLSADFGVVVLDLQKEEIREAYTNIGSSGSSIVINYATVLNDSLFLATEEGVLAGSLDPAINLLDFTNWRRFGNLEGLPTTSASTITTLDDGVWVTIDTDGVYFYQGMDWQRVDFELNEALAIFSSENELLITLPNQLVMINANQSITELSDPLYSKPQMALVDSRGLWVADSLNGLVTSASGTLISTYPSGPFSDSIAFIKSAGNTIIGLPPGYDNFRRPLRTLLGINQFESGIWTSFNNTNQLNVSSFPAVSDLVDVAFSSTDGNFYFASFSEGILQWNPSGDFQILDESTAGSTFINSPPGRNVRITSVLNLSDGTIWSTNHGNPFPLHQFDPSNGNWSAFSTPFFAARFPLDLQRTENGDFWMRLDPNNGGGIWVINPQSGQQKLLTNITGQGGLPSNRINDLVIDLEGQVWLGTEVGVAVYPFPFDILDRNDVDASRVFIDGRPLLRDEAINCIAIDGGNRKWVGTDNGLWLFSELGDQVIFNFTKDNSPLPSNIILDIEVQGSNGEVFIATDLGMMSYRGTATDGTRSHQQVSIFPNPVTREFSGTVGISGLVNNAIVKIADVTGKLVTEIRAQGGTAVWDVADLQGQRVSSGVYLVYSSNFDGSETFVGKIAVIN